MPMPLSATSSRDDAVRAVVARAHARCAAPSAVAARGAGRDRVVEHVDDRALDALAIERQARQARVGVEREVDLAMPLAEEHQRLLDQRVQVLRRVLAGRQAREGRELVHQRLQLLDLLDDRARALVEERRRRSFSCVGVALAQALRRELDRRERILDLVRDAARDLAPRLHALRPRSDLGDVLEEEQSAERLAGLVAQHASPVSTSVEHRGRRRAASAGARRGRRRRRARRRRAARRSARAPAARSERGEDRRRQSRPMHRRRDR